MDGGLSGWELEAWKPFLEYGGYHRLCSPSLHAQGPASHQQGCSVLCSGLCPPQLDQTPSWKAQPCNLDGGKITYRLRWLIN